MIATVDQAIAFAKARKQTLVSHNESLGPTEFRLNDERDGLGRISASAAGIALLATRAAEQGGRYSGNIPKPPGKKRKDEPWEFKFGGVIYQP